MLIRAREHTPISTNLTPPIPPLAAALHDKFLPSRCSSCFLPLPSFPPPLSCSSCLSLLYCSPTCSSADSPSHLSSSECHLLLLLPPSPSSPSSDIRAAIRLLSSPSPSPLSPGRVGSLLATGLNDLMREGGELAERVREGARMIAEVRNPRIGEGVAEEVLWAVMVNGVEVEDAELGGIGVAVYGPWFSWFNHSCAPNACYSFEIGLGFGASSFGDLGRFGVSPYGGAGEALDVVKNLFHMYFKNIAALIDASDNFKEELHCLLLLT